MTWPNYYSIKMHPEDTDRMSDSVDPDHTAPAPSGVEKQSDLDLHCLPRLRPVC